VEVSEDLYRSRNLGLVQGVARPDATAEATFGVVAAVGAIVAPYDELIPWASIAGLGTHSGHAFVGVRLVEQPRPAAVGFAMRLPVWSEVGGSGRTGCPGWLSRNEAARRPPR